MLAGATRSATSDDGGRITNVVLTRRPEALTQCRLPILLLGVSSEQGTIISNAMAPYGYDTIVAHDSALALEMARAISPRLTIIGPRLTYLDGLQFCREMRAPAVAGDRLIAFVCESSLLEDKLAAFAAGADDYMASPHYMPEIVLRLTSLLAHASSPDGRGQRLRAPSEPGGLRLDPHTGEIRWERHMAALTPVETRLLECLLAGRGQPVSGSALVKRIWGGPATPPKLALLRVHLRNLRAKLDSFPDAPIALKTATGLGYYVVSADA